MDSMTLAAEKQKYLDAKWAEVCARCSEMEQKKMKVSAPKVSGRVIKEIITSDNLKIIIRRMK